LTLQFRIVIIIVLVIRPYPKSGVAIGPKVKITGMLLPWRIQARALCRDSDKSHLLLDNEVPHIQSGNYSLTNQYISNPYLNFCLQGNSQFITGVIECQMFYQPNHMLVLM
jgi:hypothetical protein